MKKVFVYLGMALFTFANAAVASNLKPATEKIAIAGTPLCMAISKGDVATVKKFVEYGADVNERSNDMTPLMMAARYNNVEILELLISKGARIDAKTENGLTALQYATLSNAKEAEAFLRQKGAKK
jgi:ankyrin repeat protein